MRVPPSRAPSDVTTHRLLVVLLTMWAIAGISARAAAESLQDFRIARWTTTEGLPQNTINDIVTLSNGELWLATFGGLVRFDGARFHVVTEAALAGDVNLEEVGCGCGASAGPIARPDHDQLVRVARGERRQERGMDDAEDGRVRRNPER